MKKGKYVLIPVVIFAISIFHCTQMYASDPLLELHRSKFNWMVEEQLDSLSAVLSEDLKYIHSNGWIETKAEVLENIESGHLGYREIIIEEENVRYFGKTGIVTGRGLFRVALDGDPLEIELLYTEVYHKRDGEWELVQRHACRPVE